MTACVAGTLCATSCHDCMISGVGQKMIGMKVGESRQIQLTLPDNFEPAPLRGMDVTCTVGVSELFEYDLPEVMLHCSTCLMCSCLLLEVMLHCSNCWLYLCLLFDGLTSHSIALQLNDAQHACPGGGGVPVCPGGMPACTPPPWMYCAGYHDDSAHMPAVFVTLSDTTPTLHCS